MPHAFLTLAIPFDNGRVDTVNTCLDGLGNPSAPKFAQPLDQAAFVHFMSITVVPGSGSEKNAHLILEINADGTAPTVLERLETAIGRELLVLLEAAGISIGTTPMRDYLARHRHKTGQTLTSIPGLDFDGTPGMTVPRISAEADLAHYITPMLDDPAMARLPSALDILGRVRGKLWDDAAWKWAFVPAPAPMLDAAPSPWSAILPVAISLLGALLWPAVLVAVTAFLLAWYLGTFATALIVSCVVLAAELGTAYAWLRRVEAADVSDDTPPSQTAVRDILQHENFVVQNHMAAASQMKSGRFRRLTLRIGLWVAGQLALHVSRPGFLATTSVIHFARWILLPGTDKLLFMSNFDGTWEAYLEDFIEEARQGVTGIWSNTVGFPKTNNLFFDGAADGDRLRRWTRRQQHTSHCWYSAYPRLTLSRIRINAAIRQGIASANTEADAKDWLACFGSAPRPATTIEFADVPTLVLGGLSRLRFGTALLLRLGADVAANQRWLTAIEGSISYGNQLDAHEALLLGLSATGLAKLGLTEADLSTFPVAFQQGSAAPWRARMLGDTGTDDPEHWDWGGPGVVTDAVMMIYAADAAEIGAVIAARVAELERFGANVMREVRFTTLPPGDEPVREPFGFVDGVSQPIIRGTVRAAAMPSSDQLVAPGEFILGYADNLGYLPSTPSVDAARDPLSFLPNLGGNPTRQRPDFAEPLPTDRHDLGHSGTYLVVRQLEQDTGAFGAFLNESADALAHDPRVPQSDAIRLKEWIAAKMVGRWRDGSSLIHHPSAPGTDGHISSPDNDFRHGEDPTGMRCPFGAHIRRANPRDTFAPGSAQQLSIVNRHRILRVGRRYGPQEGKEGLFFMCLNTDIERQFEFVQRTWLLAASFNGLENEADSILGYAKGSNTLTIPTPYGPLRLSGLKDFVAVRGGGYFFMPGRQGYRFLAHRAIHGQDASFAQR
jgi:deferrochelatase/peroxidase EfeB